MSKKLLGNANVQASICRIASMLVFVLSMITLWRIRYAWEVAAPFLLFASGVAMMALSSIKTLEARIARIESMLKSDTQSDCGSFSINEDDK